MYFIKKTLVSIIGNLKIMIKWILILSIAKLLMGCANSSLSHRADRGADDALKINTTASADFTSADGDLSHPAPIIPAIPASTETATGSRETTNSLQASAALISAVGTPGRAAYKIGAQDVIEISVFKVPDLSKSIQVSEAGTINLPLVGEILAAGKTAREIERNLTKLLGEKYLQNPQVTVFIKEYNSQRITVEGAVKKPGVFPIRGNLSLLQAVAMAQGLEEISDNTVLIFRGSNGERKAARFDISDIRTGDAPDPQLMAGDVIIAGTSALKKSFNAFLKALPITGIFALL